MPLNVCPDNGVNIRMMSGGVNGGPVRLRAKIERFAPGIVAFNGTVTPSGSRMVGWGDFEVVC